MPKKHSSLLPVIEAPQGARKILFCARPSSGTSSADAGKSHLRQAFRLESAPNGSRIVPTPSHVDSHNIRSFLITRAALGVLGQDGLHISPEISQHVYNRLPLLRFFGHGVK